MRSKLGEWLRGELDRRGWSDRELARRAGLSQTSVSGIIAGTKNPGLDFCIAAGEALLVPPENLLRLAGLLPALPPGDVIINEINNLARNLSEENRADVLEYAQMRYRRQREMVAIRPAKEANSLGPLFDFIPPPADVPAGTAEKVQALMERLTVDERAALIEHFLLRRDFVETLHRRGVDIQHRAIAETPPANICTETE